MTNYELLLHKIERCEEKIMEFKDDDFLCEFYVRARMGFIFQLKDLTLEEAGIVNVAA